MLSDLAVRLSATLNPIRDILDIPKRKEPMKMAKKYKSFFGTEKPENLTDGISEYKGKEDEKEPYMVFETEAEFKEAVEREMQKRYGGAEEKKGGDDEEKRKLISDWQREAAELKAIVPDFDFSSALRNEVFRKALTSGKSVIAAYSAMTQMPKNPQRDELYQNARSPRRGTGETTINPAALSSEDFKKYIEKIRNN